MINLNKKKVLFSFLIAIFVFSLAGFVFAEEGGRSLEVEYPTIPGAVTPRTVEGTNLPEYVKYIFNAAIGVGGFIAFVVLVLGGAKYLTSAGNPTKMEDARGQIFSGILGLIILVSSYLILTTINPQLVIFETAEVGEVEVKPTPGVWLCKEAVPDFLNFDGKTKEEWEELSKEIGDKCYQAATVAKIPDEFNNKIRYVYLVGAEEEGEEGVEYGVVIHEDEDFCGHCQVIYNQQGATGVESWGSSVIPFIINPSPQGPGVTLYKHPDFNTGFEDDPDENVTWGPYGVGEYGNINAAPDCYSMEVKEREQFVVVLFEDANFSNRCEVFESSDHNLEDDYTGEFCGWGFFANPCVHSMIVIGGGVMGMLPR